MLVRQEDRSLGHLQLIQGSLYSEAAQGVPLDASNLAVYCYLPVPGHCPSFYVYFMVRRTNMGAQHYLSGRSAILDLLWLQLGNVHLDNEAADMNVSAVALAAVDIAATALDSALLSVERTVERSQQRPEVSKHASPSVSAFMHVLQSSWLVARFLTYSGTVPF